MSDMELTTTENVFEVDEDLESIVRLGGGGDGGGVRAARGTPRLRRR